MLEQLFSSKTRVKLLSLFLSNPDTAFYVRELTRKLNERINSIRRELANLEDIGLLARHEEDRKVYYQIDKSFYCFSELQNLFMKVKIGPQDRLIREIRQIPGIQYAVLTGFFTNNRYSNTDILLVGTLNKPEVQALVSEFQRELDREINFTIMDSDEYQFRRDMSDGFVSRLHQGEYIVVLDKLKKKDANGLMNVKRLHV
jgi:hypothetical protein